MYPVELATFLVIAEIHSGEPIDQHIEARPKDKAFMDRLNRRHERESELFERLAK